MRYGKDEITYLVGKFDKSDIIVKIKIINLLTDEKIELKDDNCISSSTVPGLFSFSTANIVSDTVKMNSSLFYIMEGSNGQEFIGKFTYGGNTDKEVYVDLTPIEDILNNIITKLRRISLRI